MPTASLRHFREYSVESNKEILLVFLISRKSTNVVDHVEVFRLNFDKLAWVKMESLQNKALFVGDNCCMSITTSKMGCESNCIYFTHNDVDRWWVYDMEKGSILPTCSSSYLSQKNCVKTSCVA